jgi:hypothetical protein
MAETISPVVHGGRTKTYWLSVALHVFGATLAAAAFGAALGGVGALLGAPWGAVGPLLIAGAAVVYLLRETFQLPIPTFDRKDQVPEWWRTFYSRPTASLLYGVGLGIGFLTYLTFGTFVVVALAAFASGSAAVGALVSAAFGVARSLILVGADEATGLHPDLLETLAATPGPRLLNAAALLSVATVALVVR